MRTNTVIYTTTNNDTVASVDDDFGTPPKEKEDENIEVIAIDMTNNTLGSVKQFEGINPFDDNMTPNNSDGGIEDHRNTFSETFGEDSSGDEDGFKDLENNALENIYLKYDLGWKNYNLIVECLLTNFTIDDQRGKVQEDNIKSLFLVLLQNRNEYIL